MTDRSGLVVVDKPAGLTSHDVVARLRRILHTRKVGHAGTLDPMATGVLAIGLQHGAYLVEIYRGAIRSISRDQHDAARALGLRPFTAFRLIIFPQALMRVLAPLTNQSIVLVKDTTLVSAITVMDLTLVGKMIAERSAASDAFVVVAAFYLARKGLKPLVL